MAVKWTKSQLLKTKAGQSLFDDGKIDNVSRADKMRIARKKTNELTKWAIDWLNESQQFQVHRSNNFPSQRITRKWEVFKAYDKTGKPVEFKYEKVEIHFKANNITEKILDISGFRKDGLHFEIEVKTGKDALSEGQLKRINDIKKSGGISFVFNDQQTFLMQMEKYILPKQYAF